MAGLQWLLDLTLVLLLAATLFHAIRLERALGVLKRDRGAIEALVSEFNASTRDAQEGIEKLRSTADGTGRTIARQTESATGLRDDLVFLVERGERLADRLDHLVRAGRGIAPDTSPAAATSAARPDWAALLNAELPSADATASAGGSRPAAVPAPPERVRSQAERNLLAALRTAR